MEAPATFSWVSYDNHRVPQDPKSRTLIRRHAMKNVATTRKQRKNYRGNTIQYPESVLRGEDNPNLCHASKPSVKGGKSQPRKHKPKKKKAVDDDDDTRATKPQVIHFHTIFVDDVERKMSAEFPILELIAPLTSLHLGFASISCFTSNSGRAGDLLSTSPLSHLQSRRLLSYLPSRYGKVAALTYTVDCLVARLNQITRTSLANCTSEEEDGIVFCHYAKALNEVQKAIDDDALRMSQETLYATELLGIFELLNPQPQMNSWICHAGGAARLIQLRGPDRFQTDFELALFMAHIGPIVTEAFLSNKLCFLAEEPWKRVLRAAICNDPSIPSTQSELMHELWSSLIYGPNIFKLVTDLVLAPVEPRPSIIETTIKRIQRDLDHLDMWAGLLRKHKTVAEKICSKDSPLMAPKFAAHWDSSRRYMPWQVLLGTHTMCSMLKRRLLTSLAPTRYPHIELECQSLARMAMGLDSDSAIPSKENDLPGGLFMAQTIWVARAVVNTKSMWCKTGTGIKEAGVQAGQQRSMIEKWKFRLWCKELGRIGM
ncbi:hypothetical protein THAR02_03725 [Trichoderma harzianum]|uniref:Uncharacterized protein n=1 Tax=Trichoderma harzianum TaxID=5544 RepID=A0A0F9ZVW5_TRIHA|nr:hypothetical protein THAR02_03725 [Trichoderma harzianum]